MRSSKAAFTFMVLAFAATLPASAIGETIVLTFEKECELKNAELICEPSYKTAEIYSKDGNWYGGKGQWTDNNRKLERIQEDRNFLVLKNAVSFSGSSIVHISKASGRFYWTEMAYSEMLKADDTHVRMGRATTK